MPPSHQSKSVSERRRSSRQRIAPVDYWNNSSARYDDNGTLIGIESIVGAVPTKVNISVDIVGKLCKSSNDTKKQSNRPERRKSKSGLKCKESEEKDFCESNVGKQQSTEDHIPMRNTVPPSHQSKSVSERRRSSRQRIAPVDYWNNSCASYGDDGTLIGIKNVGVAVPSEVNISKEAEKDFSDSNLGEQQSMKDHPLMKRPSLLTELEPLGEYLATFIMEDENNNNGLSNVLTNVLSLLI